MKQQDREMRKAIVEFLRRPGYRAATAKDLHRLLRIDRSRLHAFKRVLRDLMSDGEVVKAGRDRYAPPTIRQGPDGGRPEGKQPQRSGAAAGPRGQKLVSGRLQRHPRGFGFVVPDAGGPDLFVPPRGLGDLLDGDRVAVRVVRDDGRGRAEGEIVRLLERSGKRVMGVFQSAGGRAGGLVRAYDRLFESDIVIAEEHLGKAEDGMVVGVAILRPPMERRPAAGRVVEVLGFPDEPGIDLKTIIRKYGLREDYPPDVLSEAEGVPDRVSDAESRRREDFRKLPIVTIDGETAKDFDDAVWVGKNADGTFGLQVHIADVAHYVRSGGALDREAYDRGTSVYFPGTALPMLPHRLSNGICSLNPGVDRLVQSCLMTIDGRGRVVDYRFADGVIKSAERMTYTHVAAILEGHDAALMDRYRPLVPMFGAMEELCRILNEKRRRRGSIDFDLPEPEILLAATGEMTGIVEVQRNIAHRIIEEFMLAANETVAAHLFRAKVPSMYRIHERPDPKKLEEFDAVAQAFGYRLPRPFTSIEPRAFQDLVEMAKGRPEERFLSRLMLRSMKQARYAPLRDQHFGLAATCYTHFTSPIRRYPDLVVHRLLRRTRSGKPLTDAERRDLEEFLPEAALRSSRTERAADQAEWELVEWKKMAFMAGKVGEEFDGFILSTHPFGFFVELRETFIDGLVKIESLPGDRYRFHEKKQIVKGDRHGRVFKLGDPVRVRVDRVDQFMLRVEFSLAEKAPAPVARRGSIRGGGRRPGGR
ncbi:MAG TPA: ribonuclease R [Candidatus Polarisedimenticolia bacterium]|nr:ribonuclease R [Candidatus Polarisedimenticolia bacterium]